MSDTEIHLQEGQRRQGQDHDLISESDSVRQDPLNVVLESPEGRISPPLLRHGHDHTKRETDVEVRYARYPTTGTPPPPESGSGQSLAEAGRKSHGEEHLERRLLSPNAPVKAPMPNVEKLLLVE